MKLVAVLCLGAMCGGCGEPRGMVSGNVTLDGSPLAGAEIEFASGEDRFFGLSFQDGSYQVDPGSEGGLPLGTYEVSVTHYVTRQGKPLPEGEAGENMKSDGLAVRKQLKAPSQTVAEGENQLDLAVTPE